MLVVWLVMGRDSMCMKVGDAGFLIAAGEGVDHHASMVMAEDARGQTMSSLLADLDASL